MISFEVHVNGKKVCTAGVGEDGVLSAMLTYVRRENEVLDPKAESEPAITLSVGGLANDQNMRWLGSELPIESGDEVTIRVLEAESVDEPAERTDAKDPDIARKNRRYLYECYRREFENESGGELPDAETARQLRKSLYRQYKQEFEPEA
jgi:hypothetical protein